MLRWLKLAGVGPAPAMEMEFGRRINVTTGDNGLGKSFVLDVVWWALTGTWAGLPAWPRAEAEEPRIEIAFDEAIGHALGASEPLHDGHPKRRFEGGRFHQWSTFDSSEQRWDPWSLAFLPRPLPSLVMYARADGTIAIWDPARNHYKLQYGGGIYKGDALADPNTARRPQSYIFDPDTIMNGSAFGGKPICNGLIRDWVSWQQKHPDSPGGKAFAHLCEVLAALSPNPEGGELIQAKSPIRLFVDDAREFPAIDTGYGPTAIIHASAGMRRIVSLAYLIVWTWHEHVEASRLLKQEPVSNIVFLMDEVENHLHPEWQRRLMPALLHVLESLGDAMSVQLQMTTHSPMVLASLEPHFDEERDKLFVFALQDRNVVLNPERFIVRGDASRWLSSRVFGLHIPRSVEAERAMDDANALMLGKESKEHKTREEIDGALRVALPGQDPFWARWLAFVEGSAA